MNNDIEVKILRDLERARPAQESKVKYRNEKRWKIFSWSSSLLLGSIAGAVTIKKADLDFAERLLLCLAVIALASYTMFWLEFNRILLNVVLTNLNKIDKLYLGCRAPFAQQRL